jgi:hypothetical protein
VNNEMFRLDFTSLVTMVPEDVILRPNFCHRVPNWRPSLKTYTSGNAVPLPFSFCFYLISLVNVGGPVLPTYKFINLRGA